jgi:protease IV
MPQQLPKELWLIICIHLICHGAGIRQEPEMFAQLHHRLHHSPWYIQPAYFQSIKTAIAQELPEAIKQQDNAEEFFSFFINQRPPLSIDSAGIAVITISGVLANNLARIDQLLGFTDFQVIQGEIAEAIERNAKAILFEMDSPGGEVQGTAETADRIADIQVPKASYSASLDTSAAYFLSSSVDRKFVSPSAFSGSIGTMLPWVDESKFWDALGIAWEPIVGQGEIFKAAGAGPSLSEAQRSHFQEQVNAMSANFRDHVSKFRELDFGALQAGAYFGKQAIDLNLADEIGTYDDAYQWLFRLIS